jgi:S1-C subfamily serine protease
MKKVIVFVILLVSLSYSQNFPDDVTYFSLPQKIKEVKRSVISIEVIGLKEDIKIVTPQQLGSGFLVLKTGNVYAVTNHHVIKNVRKDQIILIGVNTKEGKIYNPATVIKSDQGKDIAILMIEDTIISTKKINLQTIKADQSSIGVSFFGDSSETIEGSGLILIGFPLGLGAYVTGNQPVSRIGIVAQTIQKNGFFLVDATASHGNSGGPVFNVQSVKLIGMVVGFPSDRISAYDENGDMIASFPYNSGLSVCISAREILKLIP